MTGPLGATEPVGVISGWIAEEAVLEESTDRRAPSDDAARDLPEMLAATVET
jgi:hypothetical protein